MPGAWEPSIKVTSGTRAWAGPQVRNAVAMEQALPVTRRQLLSLGALLGASACTPRLLREPGGGADAFDWTLASPGSAGLSSAMGAALREAIQPYIDSKQIAGAVTAVARHNQLVWFEAQGASDPVTGTPMRKDDLFRMMSSTKVVTAVALLTLLEEGKLSLDDKLSRFVPEMAKVMVAELPPGARAPSQAKPVPARREITLKDVLTHTSGMASGGAPSPEFLALVAKRHALRPNETLVSYMPRLARKTLDFQPAGTRWAYSPLDGFDLLARVCEVASGQTFETSLARTHLRAAGDAQHLVSRTARRAATHRAGLPFARTIPGFACRGCWTGCRRPIPPARAA